MHEEPPLSPEEVIRRRIEELQYQEANRRRAVDLAFDRVATTTGEEQQGALDNLERMLGVLGEFQDSHPWTLPSDEL